MGIDSVPRTTLSNGRAAAVPIAATVSGAGDMVKVKVWIILVWSNLAGTLGQGPDSRQAEQTCNGLLGVPLFA